MTHPSFSIAHSNRARLLVCLFFLLLLLVGFWTVPGYGLPWDELDEMDILRMNLWEYALALGQSDEVFQTMAAQEVDGIAGRIGPLTPISQSVERDHGQSAYYPLFGVVMNPALSAYQLMGIWHGYTWLFFWLGAVALYGVCRHLGLSRPFACLAVVMLMLSPRFFAEGHYNNKDIVLFSLVLLTLWQALRLIKRPRWDAGLLFALAGAVATNTKIIGLALWGLCGLAVVVQLILSKKFSTHVLWIGMGTLLSFGLFYGLLTPALWQDLGAYLGYALQNASQFSRWKGYVLFRGSVFSTGVHPLPWYYLPYMMLVSTPLWVWLSLAVGQGAALRRTLRRSSDPSRIPLLLCTLLWLVPFAYSLLFHTFVYNGWRHFYFLYGPMLALAAYGLSRAWAHLHRRKRLRRLLATLLCLCLLLTAGSMVLNHPYQYAYYNPWVLSKDINTFLERDWWNLSITNALERLVQTQAVHDASTPLTVAGNNYWTQFGVERAVRVLGIPQLQAVNGQTTVPDFWVTAHSYAQFGDWRPGGHSTLVLEIMAYGAPLVSIECTGQPQALTLTLPEGTDVP